MAVALSSLLNSSSTWLTGWRFATLTLSCSNIMISSCSDVRILEANVQNVGTVVVTIVFGFLNDWKS